MNQTRASRTVRVVPAILTDSPIELARMVAQANSFAPFVQVDIMDGVFVPTRSIGPTELRALDISFEWEAHLMVADPMQHLEPFRDAGAARVVFHVEGVSNPQAVIARARALDMGVGVALNPPSDVNLIEPLLPEVDCVLLMTVYPGYYGAPFVPDVMHKVPRVRALRADVEIGVDGGVKASNIAAVARQGVDTICIGSAVFSSPDPEASYRRLTSLVCDL